MKEILVNDTDQLIKEIENSIDNKSPVMLIVDYYTLFYNEQNYKTVHNPHGILVSEYDSLRKLFVLRESTYGQEYYDRFLLKYEDVCEIWHTSMAFSPAYCHKIFVFEKIGDIKPEFLDLLSYFLNEFNPNKDSLIDLITNGEYHYINIFFAIKIFANSFFEFFNVLEKCTDLLELSPQAKASFADLKEKYVKTRQNIILKMQTYNLRKKDLTEDLKKLFVEQIISENTDLLNFVKRLQMTKKKNVNINLSLGKNVYADSELSYPIGNSDEKMTFSADRVVNGKWNNYMTDQWKSENIDAAHWLKVDFEIKKNVNKFVVRHDPKRMYLTKDFKIQGSDDDRDWHDIVSVENNSEVTSIHKIDPVSYRYFRLYITNPGTNDYAARIFEFEIWGED